MRFTNCDCNSVCNDQRYGHTCILPADHEGPHTCHARILRLKPRRGDIVWSDGDREMGTSR